MLYKSLTPGQQRLYDDLDNTISENENGNVNAILESKLDEDVRAVLTAKKNIPNTSIVSTLLAAAVAENDVQAVKDILKKGENLGIMKEILAIQLVEGTEKFTLLEYARSQSKNTQLQQIIEIIEPKAQKAGLEVLEQPPFDPNGQAQGEGGMLIHKDLNHVQQALYIDFVREMHDGEPDLVNNALDRYDDGDLERVLSTWVDKERGTTFLTWPAERTSRKVQTDDRKKIIEAIWNKASTNVRNIWINLHTENLHDQGDIISYLTEQQKGESDTGAYNGIIQKIQEYKSKQPVGASNRVFEEKISTPVSGHDQQGDDIRSLYAQLDNNIVNGSAQIAKDSLNKLLLHDDEKFQEIVDFKERGMVSLRDKIQQKLADVVYYKGDQELIEMLKTCVGRINQIDAKLEVPARQNLPPLDEGSPPAPAAKPTSAIPSLLQQGSQHQQGRTGGSYSRGASILSDSSSDDLEDHNYYKTPTFLDKLSKHRGKIAMALNLVAIVSFTLSAVFSGSLPVVCTLGTIGIIAAVATIGIGIKIAYDEIRERAEEDGTNMWEATKSEANDLLPYMLHSRVKQHKVERNPSV